LFATKHVGALNIGVASFVSSIVSLSFPIKNNGGIAISARQQLTDVVRSAWHPLSKPTCATADDAAASNAVIAGIISMANVSGAVGSSLTYLHR